MRQWIKNDFQFLFDKYLNKELIEKHDIFNYNEVQNLISKNKTGKVDAAYTIFSIICITIWVTKMIDK